MQEQQIQNMQNISTIFFNILYLNLYYLCDNYLLTLFERLDELSKATRFD